MRYFCIYPEDPVGIFFVLSTATDDRGVELRPEYLHLRCSNCGKIDEEVAVTHHLPEDFRIRSKRDATWDVLRTADEFFLVSRRFVDVMEKEGLSGAKLLALPNEKHFMLFIAERVPGRFELSGLRTEASELGSWYGGRRVKTALVPGNRHPRRAHPLPGKATADQRCVVCGRHFETVGFVESASVTPPNDPRRFFTSSFNHESDRGNRFKVFCSEIVAGILEKHHLTGFRLGLMGSRLELRQGRLIDPNDGRIVD